MMLQCIHGYFKFVENRSGEISNFISLFGLQIEYASDHFTFEGLINAPSFSLEGGEFLDCPTTKNFEGEPWDVMRENDLVYDFVNEKIVPINTIVQNISIKYAGNFCFANGIIIPGSVTEDGKRVTDYVAHYEAGRFKYSEITRV